MSERIPAYRLRVITDVQYYKDGTCEVVRSFNIPEKKAYMPKKKKIVVPEAKEDGECEL